MGAVLENYAQVCEDVGMRRQEAVETIARIFVERGVEPEIAVEKAELHVMHQYGKIKSKK